MSMYGVNAGVPKTLVRHLVHYEADTAAPTPCAPCCWTFWTPRLPGAAARQGRRDRAKDRGSGGPLRAARLLPLSGAALRLWPGQDLPAGKGRLCRPPEYPDNVLYKWLRNFYWRFFAQQFKRSCLPDGPKVGSVTLSPRGDWRMPSDACAALWLAELEQLSIKD